MAYLDKKTGEIVLNEEEIQMFDEAERNVTLSKTPWADSVMNSLIGESNQN